MTKKLELSTQFWNWIFHIFGQIRRKLILSIKFVLHAISRSDILSIREKEEELYSFLISPHENIFSSSIFGKGNKNFSDTEKTGKFILKNVAAKIPIFQNRIERNKLINSYHIVDLFFSTETNSQSWHEFPRP